MACVLTDKTTKELKSKKTGSKIVVRKLTQKCSESPEDLHEDETQESAADDRDDNEEEISIDNIEANIDKDIREAYERWRVLAGNDNQ
jgi:hypothetical protein